MSREVKERLITVVGVALIVILSIGGAALYDSLSGGPEARQASVDSKAALDGFRKLIDRSECSTSYTNADNTAQANLLLAFGSIIESAGIGEDISQHQIDTVHRARLERREFLIRRNRINELCDPNRPGGPDLLEPDEQPQPIPLEDING